MFKVRKSDAYKQMLAQRNNRHDELSDSDQLDDIIKIEFVKKYDIPYDCLDIEHYSRDDYTIYFNLIDRPLKDAMHVDNKGNSVFLHMDQKIFLLNGSNEWGAFKGYIDKYNCENMDSFDIFKI